MPEVWIHCPQKDESSLNNSLITFDEWSMMSDGSRASRPDPAGCTKYIEAAAAPQPLMAITENGEESVISGAVVPWESDVLEEAAKENATTTTNDNVGEASETEDLELMLQKKMDNMMNELSSITADLRKGSKMKRAKSKKSKTNS